MGSSESSAKVSVGGNLVYTTSTETPSYMRSSNDAKWSVTGNVTQGEDAGTLNFGNLILKGTSENPSQLSLQSNSSVSRLTVDNNQNKFILIGYLNDTTFNSDAIIEGNAAVQYKDIDMNEKTVTVNGDMLSTGRMDFNGGTLNVNGNLTQKSENILLQTNSNLNVSGDFTFSGTGAVGSSESSAKVSVGGNLVYTTSTETPSYMSSSNDAKWSVTGNVTQGEDAGSLSFGTLNMLTKNTAVTFTNGHIDKLILAGKLKDYTITPADCYTTLIENGKIEPEPEPVPGPGPSPQPVADDDPIPGGGGATDTQPEITKDTTDLNLVKGQKFVISGKTFPPS